MDFSKAEGEKVKKKDERKKTCAHTVILTPLPLSDLRVIEVWYVILMNKNHSDTFLVKKWKKRNVFCYWLPLKNSVRKRNMIGRKEEVRTTDEISAEFAFN